MKILIVDDTQENLDAARIASSEFPDHQFLLVGNASEAAAELANVDGIITDLFFPMRDTVSPYIPTTWRTARITNENPAFKEAVNVYYDGVFYTAEQKLSDVHALLKDGTIRVAVERLVADLERQGCRSLAQEYRGFLENIPAPQFPYGAGLMLKARHFYKASCMVTDLHRHSRGCGDAASSIDGMILLLPLIEAGILTIEQAKYDGYKSLTYLGGDMIRGKDKGGKGSPAVWAEAIRLVLAQNNKVSA